MALSARVGLFLGPHSMDRGENQKGRIQEITPVNKHEQAIEFLDDSKKMDPPCGVHINIVIPLLDYTSSRRC